MGLIKNAINFGNGFNIGAVAPIDSRMRVELLSDLTTVWTAEIPAYKGMIVTVMETSDVYVLKDVDNYTNIASWVKLGSADAATTDTANALKAAKEYTDQEVKELADGAVKTNTDAIAVLNGDATKDGSVAKAVETEKKRAEGKELELNNAIATETKARQDAIDALDAEVTSSDGTHVTVKVTEVDGVITAVNVTESDIASSSATTAAIESEKTRAEAAESGLTDAIEAEVDRAAKAEAALAGRVQAIEDAPYATQTDVTNEANRAKAAEKVNADAIEAEKTRAEGKEGELATSIATEKTRAEGAESALSGRLDVIEGEGEGSVKKALADAKAYADTKIDGLDSTKTGEGTFVDVTVAQENGVITSVTVAESDIASAAVLAEVKKDVDNFFKDADFAESAKDTLKELQDYINTDVEGAATMTKAIADNKTAIENEEARAKAAEKANSDAIAAEKTRAEGKEGELATSIATETKARQDAIGALDAEVTSEDGDYVTVKVTEVDGVITAVNVTESDIASSSATTAAIAAETAAREAADNAINSTIGEVETGKTLVEMIKAAEAAAIAAATVVAEDSEFITIEQTGEAGKTQTYTIKTQDVASATATTAAIEAEKTRAEGKEGELATAISTEKTRAEGKEGELATAISTEKTRAEAAEKVNADAITAEKTRAEGVESGLESRLATVEGDYVKSVEAVEGSMITVEEKEQKVTLSLQWGTF